jgi:hypothetical protein
MPILDHPQPLQSLIAHCRALNENLPDSLPMTDAIDSLADVYAWREEVRGHLHAIDQDIRRYAEELTDAISD